MLKAWQARKVCEMIRDKKSVSSISKFIGRDEKHTKILINNLRSGRTWTHITKEFDIMKLPSEKAKESSKRQNALHHKRSLTKKEAVTVAKLLMKGKSAKDIAHKLKENHEDMSIISLRSVVCSIRRFDTYRIFTEKVPGFKEWSENYEKSIQPKDVLFTKEDILEIKELVEQGYTSAEIPEMLGYEEIWDESITRIINNLRRGSGKWKKYKIDFDKLDNNFINKEKESNRYRVRKSARMFDADKIDQLLSMLENWNTCKTLTLRGMIIILGKNPDDEREFLMARRFIYSIYEKSRSYMEIRCKYDEEKISNNLWKLLDFKGSQKKLSEDDLHKIFQLAMNGHTLQYIENTVGIRKGSASNILYGRTRWKDFTSKYPEYKAYVQNKGHRIGE